LYLLYPFDVFFDQFSERLLSLLVVEETVLVKSELFVEPVQQEFLGNDVLVHQLLHEGWCILIKLTLEHSAEVKNDRLQEVVLGNLAFVLDQVDEGLFVLSEVLQDVPCRWEQSTKTDEVKVIGWELKLLTTFVEDDRDGVIVQDVLLTEALNLLNQGVYIFES
jgi:hypothetical protein